MARLVLGQPYVRSPTSKSSFMSSGASKLEHFITFDAMGTLPLAPSFSR